MPLPIEKYEKTPLGMHQNQYWFWSFGFEILSKNDFSTIGGISQSSPYIFWRKLIDSVLNRFYVSLLWNTIKKECWSISRICVNSNLTSSCDLYIGNVDIDTIVFCDHKHHHDFLSQFKIILFLLLMVIRCSL